MASLSDMLIMCDMQYAQDMREADQEFVRSAMQRIEEETCLRFKEQEGVQPHSLLIIRHIHRVLPNIEISHMVHLVPPGPLMGHHLLVKTQGHGSCLGGNRKSRWDLHWESLKGHAHVERHDLKGHYLSYYLTTIKIQPWMEKTLSYWPTKKLKKKSRPTLIKVSTASP